jgi:hypothetical protein
MNPIGTTETGHSKKDDKYTRTSNLHVLYPLYALVFNYTRFLIVHAGGKCFESGGISTVECRLRSSHTRRLRAPSEGSRSNGGFPRPKRPPSPTCVSILGSDSARALALHLSDPVATRPLPPNHREPHYYYQLPTPDCQMRRARRMGNPLEEQRPTLSGLHHRPACLSHGQTTRQSSKAPRAATTPIFFFFNAR